MKFIKTLFIFLIHIIFLSSTAIEAAAQENTWDWEVHVLMGIPRDSDPYDDYLIKRKTIRIKL